MASSSPTTSIPIQEPVFLQFLHDVHHAYLLLHRAMALLPPTLIPNIEPTPLPSTDVWNQPDGLRPHYSDQTNAFIDNAPIPSPDMAEEETLMDELVETHLPEPHQHVAAPPPDVLPAPSKLSTRTPSPPNRKQKAKSAPKAPAKRRRRRDQSRSRSSSPLSLWTSEDKQKLRTLKADEKSRFSWKVISTKMGKSEDDVRSMWNKIKDKLGWPTTYANQRKKKKELAALYPSFTNHLTFLLGIFLLVNLQNHGRGCPIEFWHVVSHNPPAIYYVSPHSPGPLLPTASYVPREDLTYTTLTLSNQNIVFRYGLFVTSAPTQPVFAYDTSPTGYFPIGPEADATTGRTQPLLQHLDPHGRGQPSYGHLWQPVPDVQGDLPGLCSQSFRFRPQNRSHRHVATTLVDTPTSVRFLHDDWHRSRSSDAWRPSSFSFGCFELVLPEMENSSTSRCLHDPWVFTVAAYTPSGCTRHRLCCTCSSYSPWASIRHGHQIH